MSACENIGPTLPARFMIVRPIDASAFVYDRNTDAVKVLTTEADLDLWLRELPRLSLSEAVESFYPQKEAQSSC